jgi:O-antigen/teichoic acid export membrane protein
MLGVFTKNALITFLTRIATAVFTIIITVIIARVLGPRGQGIYSVAILFPSLLLIFTSFGLNSSVVCYFISGEKYQIKQILGNSIIVNFLISVFTILIGLTAVFLFSERFFPDIEMIYLILSLFLVPLSLFINLGLNVLLGLSKIKEYNVVSFLQNAFFLFFVTVFLLMMKFGVTVTILSQIFSYTLVTVFLFFIVFKKTTGVDFKLNKSYLKESFLYGAKSHLGSIFDFLHSRIDLFLINFFVNPFSAGIYFASVRLAEGVLIIPASIGTVLFPKVGSEKDPQKLKEFTPLVCRNVLFFSLLIISSLFLVSEFLIAFLYSKDFSGATLPFQVLLIGILAICGYGILSSDLAARGKPMLNTYSIGISVLVNVFLNILFIPKWGISGAAFATTISYTVMFLITIIFYTKISGNKTRDIILLKKEDLILYKNLFLIVKAKMKI